MKLVMVFLVAIALAMPVFAETLSVDQVVALSRAGIGDDAVIAKIRSSDTKFDLSTDQMIALKQAGVSGSVIAAMLGTVGRGGTMLSLTSPDPMAPHPTGIYLLQEGAAEPAMSRIDPTKSSQMKTGGMWGYALTGGIASINMKVAIANPTAHTHADNRRPIFYFFFNDSNPAEPGPAAYLALAGVGFLATSPSEFTLVRLVSRDGRREARVASFNIAGAKTGVMDKDRIAFDYALVRPGVYKVTANAPLDPGEYGFLTATAAGAMVSRVFDFSVG